MNYFDDLVKETNNEYAGLVSEGVSAGDVTDYIDSGSYVLNALVSGSIFGGFPSNKITAIAGEQATGKTFFVLGMVKSFLDSNPTGGVLYFESESALSKEMVESRGIDSKRMYIMPVTTIQEFRTQALKVIETHLKTLKKDRPPLVMCLDSLGNLSTEKEVNDMSEGKDTRDMTRAQLIRGAFRVLTLKAGQANIPIFITNHTFDVIGSYVPMKDMGGGAGLKYAASNIIFLGKKKIKDGTEVIGNIVKAKNYKSRLTKENKQVEVAVRYDSGLDRHYGLLDLALRYNIFSAVSTRVELPDGSKQFGKTINENPEKFFTQEILEQIDEGAKKEFLYSSTEPMPEEEDGESQTESTSTDAD